MCHFDIFVNSGGRYRFGKFHNSQNLETQALKCTQGFTLVSGFSGISEKKIFPDFPKNGMFREKSPDFPEKFFFGFSEFTRCL